MSRLGIGFGAERLGIAAISYPRIALLCLSFLMSVIGLSLPQISFDDDIHRVFLSDSPISQAQRAYDEGQMPATSIVLIHLSKPSSFTAADMSAVRDLSLDLEFIDGVSAVGSPFLLRWPPEAGTPSGRPLFDMTISKGFAEDLSRFEELGTGLPTFINQDRTAILLSMLVDIDAASLSAALAIAGQELNRLTPLGISTAVTGEDVLSNELVTGLKVDLITLNVWGALIVALAAIVILRDLRMTILALVPALLGSSGVLALSVWLGYPITVLNNVIPILLLVLGVADGVHLAGHVRHGGSPHSAIKAVGPACALTALTTATAFSSIMLTGNVQLFEFAVLGALGTLLSFAIMIVAFALTATAMPLNTSVLPDASAHVSRKLVSIGTKRPRLTVAIGGLLLVASCIGFSQTRAWFPIYQFLPGNSLTPAVNDTVAEDFGGVFRMIVEARGTWPEVQALASDLEAINGQGTVLSEVNVAKWLNSSGTRPTAEDLANLPSSLSGPLSTPDGLSRIFVSVPEPMRSEAALARFERLYDTATAAGATVIGLPTIMRVEAINLIVQLSLGLVFAALGATFLVAFAFRAVWMVPILIVPNALPLMLTGASLHIWAQGQLNPTAVLALTIAFGIAIDDTVHFLSRFTQARQGGHTLGESIDRASRSAGQVMVITTGLLAAGLCVTLLSDFATIRLFGTMMITTLIAALIVDLTLLPALLLWKQKATDDDGA